MRKVKKPDLTAYQKKLLKCLKQNPVTYRCDNCDRALTFYDVEEKICPGCLADYELDWKKLSVITELRKKGLLK